MTWEEFETMVARLSEWSRRSPRSYRTRVFLFALLGYAYLFVVLLLLLGCIGAIVWIAVTAGTNTLLLFKALVPLLALAGVILGSLWVEIEPPEGLVLTREQTGRLFQTVEEFRRKLKGPKIHTALVTDDFNVGISQVPRLGMFGWHKNYLVLGLPLMQALGPDQFRAVLAHEFGHLSGSHSKFSAWIYRVRLTWQQLIVTLEQRESWAVKIFRYFFEWYAPFFAAYSFVLARAQEYEADRLAAELVGARTAADALICAQVSAAFLEESFWPGIYSKALTESVPQSAPYSEMQLTFRSPMPSGAARRWLDGAMNRKTETGDTHPSLSDRLQALGQEAHALPPAPISAAELLFGESLDALAAAVDRKWRDVVAGPWRERHEQARKAKQRLKELGVKGVKETLSDEEVWERATITEEFQGPELALPCYQEMLGRRPDHAGASFAMGRLMLADNREEGIDLIEQAMKLDARSVDQGCGLIYDYLIRHNKEQEASAYYGRASYHAELVGLAEKERAGIGLNETYLPHGLTAETVDSLAEQLRRYPEISAVYLVRKDVRYFPEFPFYALGVEPKRAWYSMSASELDANLCQDLASQLKMPGETIVFTFNYNNARLKDVILSVPGSLIYRGLIPSGD